MKNDRQKAEFLRYYSKIVDMVVSSRNSGKTLAQIALELNLAGYVTREGSQFSQIHISRILGKVAQPGAQESVQNAVLESQVQSEVEQLKSEICTLKTQVEEMQQELSELKAQLFELKDKIQLQKSSYVEITVDSQDDKIKPVELMPRQSTKPARPVGSEIKKAILQQANQLHAENDGLTKTDIAMVLSRQYHIQFRAVSNLLKKLW